MDIQNTLLWTTERSFYGNDISEIQGNGYSKVSCIRKRFTRNASILINVMLQFVTPASCRQRSTKTNREWPAGSWRYKVLSKPFVSFRQAQRNRIHYHLHPLTICPNSTVSPSSEADGIQLATFPMKNPMKELRWKRYFMCTTFPRYITWGM